MGKVKIKEENLEKVKGLHNFMPNLSPPLDLTVPDLSTPDNRPRFSFSPPDMADGYREADVGMPTVPVLLVCPTCKVDVEPNEPNQFQPPEGELVYQNPDVKNESAFCYCPKCGISYFKYELIKWRSWRRKM